MSVSKKSTSSEPKPSRRYEKIKSGHLMATYIFIATSCNITTLWEVDSIIFMD